jgi:AcrR family transcriptional regulator
MLTTPTRKAKNRTTKSIGNRDYSSLTRKSGAGRIRRLPPGSHGIPPEIVARNQRERLVAAMAEVCAEKGYAGASVVEVSKRGGVSSVTFYKQFADKRDCLLAAHGELLGRLLEEVDRACEVEGGEGERSRAALRAVLAVLAADPPSARLLTVEVLAAGPEGVEHHDAMVEALDRRLDAGWVSVAGVLALIGKLVVAGEASRLPSLEDELADTLSLQS